MKTYISRISPDDYLSWPKYTAACRPVARQWLYKKRQLLGNGRNRFVTRNNGVTGKQRSLRGPCSSFVTQYYYNYWKRCFLCSPYQGYITRSSCNYERVLRRQLEEQKSVVRHSTFSKDVNTEAEEATALEAVTRRLRRLSACCSELYSVCELSIPL
jgi:hypothetical protein